MSQNEHSNVIYLADRRNNPMDKAHESFVARPEAELAQPRPISERLGQMAFNVAVKSTARVIDITDRLKLTKPDPSHDDFDRIA